MSSMLEQAIIDASALREAALKNAQSEIIEKYSDEIKNAVSSLLEQEDPLAEDPMLDPGMPPEAEELQPDMPLAAHDDEKLCPCPDDEEEIEIDFTELTRRMDQEGGGSPDEMISPEEAVGELPMMEEEISLEGVDLESIIEELTVDMQPVKSGWAGTPQPRRDHADEVAVAALQDTQKLEEFEGLRDAVTSLEKVNESLKQELDKTNSNLQEQKNYTKTLKEKLIEVNNLNGKLFYQNKALTTNSLNERQKKQFVDALSKAGTIEEAKIIFETLQSAVGPSGKKRPQSLSEAVERPSMTSLNRRRNSTNSTADPVKDRWKALAGIKVKDN